MKKTIDPQTIFYNKYKFSKIKSKELEDEDIGCGVFETYGKDKAIVKKICDKNPKRVWTVVDGEDGNLWVIAGWHFCNRVLYVITDEEWKDPNEEYRY